VIFSLFHNGRKVELINNAGRMNACLCYIGERINLHVIHNCALPSAPSLIKSPFDGVQCSQIGVVPFLFSRIVDDTRRAVLE